MEIYVAKSLWKEKKGFSLYRENLTEYIFIHFLTPVKARLGGLYKNILSGGCVIFAINSPQEFSSPDCELIHDWFHADLHFGDLMNKYGVESEKVYYPEDDEEITEIVRTAELEYMRGEHFYREAVRAEAEKLLIKMARSENKDEEKLKISRETAESFKRARAKIHSEYEKEWNVEKMAELVSLSPSRFAGIYKAVFGVPPVKDLISLRIERAKILLSCGECSVKGAAEAAGYNSEYNFIRQFKEHTGVTPGHYKK